VLYCALEDTPRRLQDRLLRVLAGDEPAPGALHITTVLGRGSEAIDYLSEWLADHPDARLVIIDVLAKIRPPSDARKPLYETDYQAMSAFKSLADHHGVAIVRVHHTRKSPADDVFNEVSGSAGMTGGADAVLLVKRARNTSEAVLSVTGRDIPSTNTR
jgi:hypothetical protein